MPLDLSPETLQKMLDGLAPETEVADTADRTAVTGTADHSNSKWPYLAAAAGQGMDLASTGMALRNPMITEGNPIGLKAGLLGKAALLPLSLYAIHRAQETGHPTRAKVIGALVGLEGGIPAAMNIRTMTKGQ